MNARTIRFIVTAFRARNLPSQHTRTYARRRARAYTASTLGYHHPDGGAAGELIAAELEGPDPFARAKVLKDIAAEQLEPFLPAGEEA
ncbi:MAG: hypothetical protein Kow0067_00280 [Coriobacteriia bacterium]